VHGTDTKDPATQRVRTLTKDQSSIAPSCLTIIGREGGRNPKCVTTHAACLDNLLWTRNTPQRMRTSGGWLVLGLTVLCAATPSHAYFLDQGRNFDVRLRAYSQLGILTESSEKDWPGNGPNTCVVNGKESTKCRYHAGDLAQHRNFYNPEFDAKLTDYMQWMHGAPGLSRLTPDDFKFRYAWWGFYDGLYDYLNGPWNFNRRNLKARVSQSDNI